jgi:hypothetical protein
LIHKEYSGCLFAQDLRAEVPCRACSFFILPSAGNGMAT